MSSREDPRRLHSGESWRVELGVYASIETEPDFLVGIVNFSEAAGESEGQHCYEPSGLCDLAAGLSGE